jgi:hypothetical protein
MNGLLEEEVFRSAEVCGDGWHSLACSKVASRLLMA